MIKIVKVLTVLFISIDLFAATVTPSQLEAKILLEKMTGTKIPLTHSLIQPMADKIFAGDRLGAAKLATTHPNFLNITVKLMALGLSTREETLRQDLNDFAAMFIGVTRDQTDARELLTGNFEYVADPAKVPAGVTIRSNPVEDVIKSNNHFHDIGLKLDIGNSLMRISGQRMRPTDDKLGPVANPDPAGVLTSRSFILAHATAGTNRRLVEYTMREFMCSPIENWADVTVSDDRIGRDIDRFPGGDHQKFLTSCKACHTVMDGFRGAFSKWDATDNSAAYSSLKNGGSFDGKGIATKMNKNNNVFPDGYVMTDDSFINNGKGTANTELFGWRETRTVNMGVHQFGELISNSKRFSQCMVKRTFEAVCRRALDIKSNINYVNLHAGRFEETRYNLNVLFQEVVVSQECQ